MMFAYASLIGIARRNHLMPMLPIGHYFRSLFCIGAGQLHERKYAQRVVFYERSASAYDRRTQRLAPNVDLAPGDIVELHGFFQSWKYFHHVANRVRAELVFRGEPARDARRFLDGKVGEIFGASTRRANVVVIGVHVRVKDMASARNAAQGYTIATAGYLARAIEFFKRRHASSKLMFVLCTDDRLWCNKNFPISDVAAPLVQPARFADTTDLAILTACNHTIMTIGSFGWWAAWLAGGTTVYYSDYPRPNSSIAANFVPTDYFLPDWIGMR